MNDHLTPERLTALISGELSAEELSSARAHLGECLACANLAVDEWLLKTAVRDAGRRYEAPAEFLDRMASLVKAENSRQARQKPAASGPATRKSASWPGFARWAAAAMIILAIAWLGFLEYRGRSVFGNRVESAEIAEACDLHIAMLAATQPPQVVSSDRHTVKPWFQGKLPFSFNIPESLPAGTTLDGANLAYLDNHPVAQLLFSIDRHRVSVFVQEKGDALARGQFAASHAGFHVDGAAMDGLELIAVSDVEAGRLDALLKDLLAAQENH